MIEVRDLGKRYGGAVAICGISTGLRSAEVTCVLGPNGAGKSTLARILSGAERQDSGQYLVAGTRLRPATPRQTQRRGIATAPQDLAMAPLLSIWRTFFLGSEPTAGIWPFRRLDVERAQDVTIVELARFGIDVHDPNQPVGTLSSAERQCIAVARAIYFGARLLVLDEPTAFLAARQAAIVLRNIVAARGRGLGVVIMTPDPRQFRPVADRFILLHRGVIAGDSTTPEVDLHADVES